MAEWWQTFFDEYYLDAGFSQMKRRVTLRDLRFIERVLALKKGAKILDVCCGIGRHAVELAARGYRVTGVDYVEKYLEAAGMRAKRRQVKVDFRRCDMRNIRYRDEFHAAICMWTSFGYFEKESDSLKGLRAIRRALKPGGKFLLDLINRDWLIKNFQPYGHMQTDKGFVLERREFDPARSRIVSEWTYVRGAEVARRKIDLRIYSVHELTGLLERAGFKVAALFGDRKNVMPMPEHRILSVLCRK